jgi:solute carrier family 34 (sodium-dependent phosphate cotransporter)
LKAPTDQILVGDSSTIARAQSRKRLFMSLFMLLLVLFVFILSIELLGNGFRLFNLEVSYLIYTGTSNPFISLFVGLLATAIFQSSSTVTSVIVALVGVGTITIENAVPIVMGANIGTTATSTFVALNFLGTRKQLRRAIMAATVHDFFNVTTALVLFPLEIMFGTLSKSARLLSTWITPENFDGNTAFSLLSLTVKPSAEWISQFFYELPGLLISVSIIFVALSIALMSSILKGLLLPENEQKVNQIIFSSRPKALIWGVGITAAIQSSSVTTSVMVPLVAYNKIPIQKAFPFIIGANIGTTFTALLAAVSQSQAAISIAIAHLLFNIFGGLMLYSSFTSNLIIWLSRQLGNAVLRHRGLILVYLLSLFFLIPGLLIFSGIGKVSVTQYTYEQIFKGQQSMQSRIVWDQHWVEGEERHIRSFVNHLGHGHDSLTFTAAEQVVEKSSKYVQLNDFIQPLPSFSDSCTTISASETASFRLCPLDTGLLFKSEQSKQILPSLSFSLVRLNSPNDSMVMVLSRQDYVLLERKVYREGNLYMQETLIKKFPDPTIKK